VTTIDRFAGTKWYGEMDPQKAPAPGRQRIIQAQVAALRGYTRQEQRDR